MASTSRIANEGRFNTGTPVKATAHPGKEGKALLLVGGWSGVIGALLALLANSLHPHPSDFHLDALLREIAQNGAWTGVHLTLIFGLLLVIGAMLSITFAIKGEPGATISRYAGLATILGGALILVSTAIDGFAMNLLARSWFDVSMSEKATVLLIADAFENAQYAVYSLSVAVFLGIGIFLYGLATVLSSSFPKALGWLAIISGAGACVVGILQLLGGPTQRGTEIFFVVFSILSTAWIFLMGVMMWRQARKKEEYAES